MTSDMPEPAEPATQLGLMGLPVAPTGDQRVDAALERLQDVAELPSADQVEVFDEVHRRLQDALAQTHE